MARSAILAVKIIGDATQAVAAMDKAKLASMTFADKVKAAAGKAKIALAAVGAGAAVCVNAASDLQQSVGGVETVFGKSSDQMLEWSRQAAQAVGLSQNAYNEFATVLGSQLQNMGMNVEDSAQKTNELIGLGADLASMFGGSVSDAVDALSSALKGEMDPIERYGVSLNDNTLKARAAAMGLEDLYTAGDRNAKMQTILAEIGEQTARAQGNFAKEASTAAGQQERMNAEFENAKATLGEALLPALTEGARLLGEFAQWVQRNTTWLGPLAAVIAAVAAVIVTINAVMTAYTAVTTAAAIAQGALNVAMLPVIAVIVALIAVIALTIANWDALKKAGGAAADWIKTKWDQFVSWLSGIRSSIGRWGSDTWNDVKNTAKSAVDSIGGFFTNLKNDVLGVFDSIIGGIRKAFDWVSSLWGKITGAKTAAADLPSTASIDPDTQPRMYRMARTIQTPDAPTAVSATPIASLSRRSTFSVRPAERKVTYNMTFNGILDGEDAGRKVRKVLADYERKRS